MPKGFDYTEDGIEKSIREHLKRCSPSFISDSKGWYIDTRDWCRHIAVKNNIELIPVIGCFSALSSQCSVKQNKIFLEAFINKVYKHTKVVIGKCNRIMADSGYIIDSIETYDEKVLSVLDILGGEKTKSFFLNIYYPYKATRVTIDRHVLKLSGIAQPSVTKKQYLFIEDVWKKVAKDIDLLPHELQTILWVKIRQDLGKDKMFD